MPGAELIVLSRCMSPLRQLSDTEAAYLAGIIDGEGTITLTRTHRGENRRPVVSISSTEMDAIHRISAQRARPSSSASLPTHCAQKRP
jgi:hypothetical protein